MTALVEVYSVAVSDGRPILLDITFPGEELRLSREDALRLAADLLHEVLAT